MLKKIDINIKSQFSKELMEETFDKVTLEKLLKDADEADRKFEEAMKNISNEAFRRIILPESIKEAAKMYAVGSIELSQVAEVIEKFPFHKQADLMRDAMNYVDWYYYEYAKFYADGV